MVAAGLGVTLAGFFIAVASLGVAAGNGARLAIILAGIAVSLFGIFGMLNPHYLKNAPWNR